MKPSRHQRAVLQAVAESPRRLVNRFAEKGGGMSDPSISNGFQVIDAPRHSRGTTEGELRPFIEAAQRLPEGKAVVVPLDGDGAVASARSSLFRLGKLGGFKVASSRVNGVGLAIWIKRSQP